MIIPGVAIKSVMDSAEFVAVQYRSLAADRDIYVFDRREDLQKEQSIYDMAGDIIAAMDMLDIKNADIYGVSQGGMIAQVIAAQRKDLVRRLILCSTAAYIPQASRPIFERWIDLAQNKDVVGLMESFAETIYSDSYRKKCHQAFIEFAKMVNDDDLQRFLCMVKGMADLDIRGSLGDIKCPVLALGAMKDNIFTARPTEEIASATGAMVHIYSEGSHAVYDEEPDVLVRIKEFTDNK